MTLKMEDGYLLLRFGIGCRSLFISKVSWNLNSTPITNGTLKKPDHRSDGCYLPLRSHRGRTCWTIDRSASTLLYQAKYCSGCRVITILHGTVPGTVPYVAWGKQERERFSGLWFTRWWTIFTIWGELSAPFWVFWGGYSLYNCRIWNCSLLCHMVKYW